MEKVHEQNVFASTFYIRAQSFCNLVAIIKKLQLLIFKLKKNTKTKPLF